MGYTLQKSATAFGRRTQFEVLILPNLYGDILTDEAAEFQGGVGTAGSANLGKRYCMFEAIHGKLQEWWKKAETFTQIHAV